MPSGPPAKPRGADPATTVAAGVVFSEKKKKKQKKNTKDKKRKRRNPAGEGTSSEEPPPAKHRKTGHGQILQSPDAVKHALLAQYYPTTLTLRQYVLDNLPASSRLRRRKIAAIGTEHVDGAEAAKLVPDPGVRAQLATFLDTTLVGLQVPPREVARALSENRLQQWIDYSQRDDSHVTLSSGDASAVHFQSEIVDFIIWLLFSRVKSPADRPHHLLCDGFRKNIGPRQQAAQASVQGLFSLYFNERVAAIKKAPWPQLLQLLGESGESMMINLLLDCSIFLRVEAGQGNYYQLSGTPIFECDSMSSQTVVSSTKKPTSFERRPTEIIFVRSRMLYARAALNARGSVQFGLRHIHALNRFPLCDACAGAESAQSEHDKLEGPRSASNTHRIMLYMFPRQFGLHNVFTSHVDMARTAQKFQDYTLREEEVLTKFRRVAEDGSQHLDVRIPKRLRGKVEHLVRRLQTLHARCSYARLLEHYCPAERPASGEGSDCHSHGSSAKAAPLTDKLSGKVCRSRRKSRQSLSASGPESSGYSSLTELAVPVSGVSAFCQAALSKIIPHEFYGLGDVQHHNRRTFLRNVDRVIRLRRFETISLHEVMQGLKVTEVDWLEPLRQESQKCSQTDFSKRREILSEFVYYVFDSLLIPLIRSNFYVTESNTHRYRLFFFRHDVWRAIAEPAMAELKTKMFEEVKPEDAMRILDSRRLGYSHARLLPKQMSMRPIMNLRRRTASNKDKTILGQSINSILAPVSNMLKLEKESQPASTLHASRLGSAMFSVGEIYERISSFKQRLGPEHRSFYFTKVDVQAAFDTIPQAAIIALIKSIPSQDRYEMIKHVEVAPNEHGAALRGPQILKRWHTSARAAGDTSPFLETLARQTAPGKKNVVYVDSVLRRTHGTGELLALAATHVQQNLVRIGKRYYRQKEGIPQGSVLSSALCNYFYADLERTRLQFLRDDDSLLLRIVDDFLLITTDRIKAARFVAVMQAGVPEYGVTISPSKTLVNFPLTTTAGALVPALPADTTAFPYCGLQINTHTLGIARDRGVLSRSSSSSATAAARDPTLSNALTVEFARRPGYTFRRKTLAAFRRQSHAMFFDARLLGSARLVLRALTDALVETAAKAWAYARCLPAARRPPLRLWAAAVDDLAAAAHLLLTSPARRARHPGYECRIDRRQVRWLVLGAFRRVLGRKQAGLGEVLGWLDAEMASLRDKKRTRCGGGDAVACLV